MLISTNVKMELLQDVDLLFFSECDIRGGTNGVAELRHFTADNPHLNRFDPNAKKYIRDFFGCNFPVYRCIANNDAFGKIRKEFNHYSQSVFATLEDTNVGYFVGMDLKNHQHLHDSHNGLPLAPDTLCIRFSWFSLFAKFFGLNSNRSTKLVEILLDIKVCVSSQEPEVLR